MIDTMTRYLEGIIPTKMRHNLRRVFEPAIDRMSSQALRTAGLVISSTTTLAKIGAADYYASVAGALVKIAAGTDMPVLTGWNYDANKFSVACFYVDGAGALTMLPGTQGATLGAARSPAPPKNQA